MSNSCKTKTKKRANRLERAAFCMLHKIYYRVALFAYFPKVGTKDESTHQKQYQCVDIHLLEFPCVRWQSQKSRESEETPTSESERLFKYVSRSTKAVNAFSQKPSPKWIILNLTHSTEAVWSKSEITSGLYHRSVKWRAQCLLHLILLSRIHINYLFNYQENHYNHVPKL